MNIDVFKSGVVIHPHVVDAEFKHALDAMRVHLNNAQASADWHMAGTQVDVMLIESDWICDGYAAREVLGHCEYNPVDPMSSTYFIVRVFVPRHLDLLHAAHTLAHELQHVCDWLTHRADMLMYWQDSAIRQRCESRADAMAELVMSSFEVEYDAEFFSDCEQAQLFEFGFIASASVGGK